MHKYLLISAFLLLTACGNDAGNSSASNTDQGQFTGTVNDNNYEVAISCSFHGTDNFTFKSDNTDAADSNGDGLIISGFQNGDKLIFSLSDNGAGYSTPNLQTWNKTADGATGSGALFPEGGGAQANVNFTVDCG